VAHDPGQTGVRCHAFRRQLQQFEQKLVVGDDLEAVVEHLDAIRLGGGLVAADAGDAGEAQRDARFVARLRCAASKATSSTSAFSTSRTGPKRAVVWLRIQRSSQASSSSV
jgi:hypothetical protein